MNDADSRRPSGRPEPSEPEATEVLPTSGTGEAATGADQTAEQTAEQTTEQTPVSSTDAAAPAPSPEASAARSGPAVDAAGARPVASSAPVATAVAAPKRPWYRRKVVVAAAAVLAVLTVFGAGVLAGAAISPGGSRWHDAPRGSHADRYDRYDDDRYDYYDDDRYDRGGARGSQGQDMETPGTEATDAASADSSQGA